MNQDAKELMLDLLCKKAVYGLTEQEETRLADLQRDAGVDDESLSFELTAAAIGTGTLGSTEELPSSMRARITADAERYFDRGAERDQTPIVAEETRSDPTSWFGWLGWAFAAAASVVLAFNVYYTKVDSTVAGLRSPTPTPEVILTPDQMRDRLIASAPDLARGTWGEGKMSEISPSGDVVWSDSQQAGYIRISGLPKNDPQRETYQLWIVAENQDPKTPVDGGTFDINADGEVIIPIDPKVKALNPQAFAITIEKPGGVPVSTQGRLAALAKRET